MPRFQVVGVVVKVGHLSLLQYKESHLWDLGLLELRTAYCVGFVCLCDRAFVHLWVCAPRNLVSSYLMQLRIADKKYD